MTTDSKPKKRARIDESENLVTIVQHSNPANHLGEDVVDFKVLDAEENRRDIQRRLSGNQLDPQKTGRLSNSQQAFNVWSIPVTIDSKLLTVKELRSELSVRGLATSGSKDLLIRRLDYHLKEKESHRVKE